ncbi:PDC sensor domain-containing protein [Massilia phosphatilytica]
MDFVCFVGIAVWSRTLAYQNQIREGVVATRDMSDAALRHAESTLDAVGWMLTGLAERIEAGGNEREGLRRLMLVRVREHGSPLDRLFVIDKAGRLVAGTADQDGADLEDVWRASVAYHRAHPDRGIRVGAPAGRPFLTVSRRVDDADGRYAGVVLATIPQRYFQDFYRQLASRPHDIVSLALADGTPLARVPAATARTAAAPPIRLKTRATEVELLHGVARSAKYGLVADAAVSKVDVLADWRRATWQESAAQAGEMLAVYLASYWLIGQMRIRERLERTLRSTQDTLEKQNAALARLADTDGLTGLHNRAAIWTSAWQRKSRAPRASAPRCRWS